MENSFEFLFCCFCADEQRTTFPTPRSAEISRQFGFNFSATGIFGRTQSNDKTISISNENNKILRAQTMVLE